MSAENRDTLHSFRQGGPIPCKAFEFYCPTKIYFGKGAEAKVGEAIKHFGLAKVFIVYGGHSAVKSGLIARIEQTLTDEGLST